MNHRLSTIFLTTGVLITACAEQAQLPESAAYGPEPTLPEPTTSMIPTVNIAEAVGWPDGRTPSPADGTQLTKFADDLQNPRWLYELPNGDILVAESNAPEGGSPGGIKGWAMDMVKDRAIDSEPSADRITLLRDTDGDGIADTRHAFLEGLHSPFGMALVGEYVDDRVAEPMPVADSEVIRPDYALGNHTASLGLAWVGESTLPDRFSHGMIVGQHGSWNRRPHSGYRVIFVPFENGQPNGEPLELLTGFRDDEEDVAYGRPAGVMVDQAGALLVADGVGGAVWRVSGARTGAEIAER